MCQEHSSWALYGPCQQPLSPQRMLEPWRRPYASRPVLPFSTPMKETRKTTRGPGQGGGSLALEPLHASPSAACKAGAAERVMNSADLPLVFFPSIFLFCCKIPCHFRNNDQASESSQYLGTRGYWI